MGRRRRFRWTRKTYREAHRAARVFDGYGFMYHDEPPMVARFRELWEAHPQHEDPLTRPLWARRPPGDDDVPF
ncbi:hypothetical protein QRO08_16015 [Paracidovorax citrulli]|uniref:Uncharacterized protein n=1 Tax=Paracidovorax citrulli TaxID=80869 RepID=A0ABY9AKS1_PARCI|nr:hypothetical protein [Paracidovorax citrulli]ATG94659.1 hypothetical protein CQB05_11995 [Paracidovorax citrulli]MVT38610.1 hypothetical protein [Paracidovorax citrulli]PVY66531.1 hypothetical protein C8E08_3940 [Paracidovorax citrulli]REG69300.1 hypothetical protein C8E07_2447 [Paracidovorax citrulli]RLJ93855.1 hypothetical protein C8E06_2447 [Paracidovorax citrulli]